MFRDSKVLKIMDEKKKAIYDFIIDNFSRSDFISMTPDDEYDKYRDKNEAIIDGLAFDYELCQTIDHQVDDNQNEDGSFDDCELNATVKSVFAHLKGEITHSSQSDSSNESDDSDIEERNFDIYDEIDKTTYRDFKNDQREQVENADYVMLTFLEIAKNFIKLNKLSGLDIENPNYNMSHITGFILQDGTPIFTYNNSK